jgi:hypothetical protein
MYQKEVDTVNITPQWRSHQWKAPNGEKVEVSVQARCRFECTACGRAFVSDEGGNNKWAINQHQKIYFGEIGQCDAALEEAVSERWLHEYCPKRQLSADAEDRQKIPNVTS